MKKLLTIISVLGLLTAPVAFADTATTKIGIINIAKIMQESKQAEKARNELKKKFGSQQDDLTKLQAKIKADQDTLSKDKTVLAKKDLQKLQDQFENNKREFQRKQQAFVQDLQVAQTQVMRDLSQDLNKIVQDIAKNDKYDLILQRDQVVFASDSVDITAAVLKELNKKSV